MSPVLLGFFPQRLHFTQKMLTHMYSVVLTVLDAHVESVSSTALNHFKI